MLAPHNPLTFAERITSYASSNWMTFLKGINPQGGPVEMYIDVLALNAQDKKNHHIFSAGAVVMQGWELLAHFQAIALDDLAEHRADLERLKDKSRLAKVIREIPRLVNTEMDTVFTEFRAEIWRQVLQAFGENNTTTILDKHLFHLITSGGRFCEDAFIDRTNHQMPDLIAKGMDNGSHFLCYASANHPDHHLHLSDMLLGLGYVPTPSWTDIPEIRQIGSSYHPTFFAAKMAKLAYMARTNHPALTPYHRPGH